MSGSQFTWTKRPSAMGRELAKRVAAVPLAIGTLAQVEAARSEGEMKLNAPWTDQTGFARNALYARAENMTIYLGTANAEYGIFLELGTINMAPRPVIEPQLNITAERYFRDAVVLIKGLLGG